MSDFETITACRSCGNDFFREILSLGQQPLANALVDPADRDKLQDTYPLTLVLCPACLLVQIRETVSPQRLFGHYVYFSSQSQTMVASAKELVNRLASAEQLGTRSFVLEVASNDGYLLQHYKSLGIPYLGIDPAANVAAEANRRGIATRVDFFDECVAEEYREKVDVLHANNVLAHVADTRGFVQAIATVMKPAGLVVVEFPYIGSLLERVEFDTIYHEHLCYFSVTALSRLFSQVGLKIERVERLPIHGGSLRVFARRTVYWSDRSFNELWLEERDSGIELWKHYRDFGSRVSSMMQKFWERAHELGDLAAYGAAAKGSTLLNYHAPGRDPSLFKFIADSTPAKQGMLSPGGCIPIVEPAQLRQRQPKHCVILPWNFAKEIASKESGYTSAGGKFWVPDAENGLIQFKGE